MKYRYKVEFQDDRGAKLAIKPIYRQDGISAFRAAARKVCEQSVYLVLYRRTSSGWTSAGAVRSESVQL